MRYESSFLALLLLLVVSCGSGSSEEDQRDVRRVFDAHQDALARSDGQGAARLLSQESLARFEELAQLALTADEVTVRARPFLDRVMILSQRHLIPPDELRQLVGPSAYARTVEAERGLKPAPTSGRKFVGDVQIMTDRASAVQIEDGKGAGRIHFVRESGHWRIDLLPTLEEASRQLERTYRRQGAGLSEDEYLLDVIGKQTGRPVTETIWAPAG